MSKKTDTTENPNEVKPVDAAPDDSSVTHNETEAIKKADESNAEAPAEVAADATTDPKIKSVPLGDSLVRQPFMT